MHALLDRTFATLLSAATLPAATLAAILICAPPAQAADYEIGNNDVLISLMGNAGQTSADGIYAFDPAAAYDPVNHQILVVWSGVDSVVDGEEIWGQRIDAATGASLGGDFPISDSGFGRTAKSPAVAYDSLRGRFLVVWSSDANALGEFEIRGQVIDAAGGQVGFDDFQISSAGPAGDVDYDAGQPSIAYNTTHDRYLVVWSADALVDGEDEIWAQEVNAANPAVVPFQPRQITDYGAPGDTDLVMRNPDLIYQADDDEYVVVAEAGTTANPQIFGHRLLGTNGAPVGTLIQTSFMSLSSPGGENLGKAKNPAIAYSSSHSEYFIVWDGAGFLNEPGETEIWGRRMTAPAYDHIDFTSDVELSQAAPVGSATYFSNSPDVVFDAGSDQYMVVFRSNHIIPGEFEVRALSVHWKGRLAPGVAAAGYLLSDMGGWSPGVPNPNFDAYAPIVIETGNHFFTAWYGDDDTAGLGDDELEIQGQLFSTPGSILEDGFELGVICFWTVVGSPDTPTCN